MTRLWRSTCLALACALGGAFGASPSAAGSWCGPTEPVCADYWAADAVFVGIVVSSPPDRHSNAVSPSEDERGDIERIQVRSEPANPLRPVVVELIEGFRGLGDLQPGARIDVDAAESIHGGSTYMFFAHRKDGRLTVYGCARTRPLFEAAADLLYARGLAASKDTAARVYGQLQWEMQPEIAGRPPAPDPLPTATITITGPGTEVRLVSDGEGHWETRLPPGTYRARLELPAAYSAIRDLGTFTIADPRACRRFSSTIDWNGRVTGRVVDAKGRPVAGLPVGHTSPAQGRPFWRPGWTLTREDGTFELDRLERGEQNVAIGADLLPAADWITRRIQLGPAEHVEFGTVRLPARVPTTTVRGRVVDGAGSPVTGAMVWIAEPGQIGGIAHATTDAAGRYVLAAMPKRRYIVSVARLKDETVDEAQTAPFEAAAGAGPPPLVLPARR